MKTGAGKAEKETPARKGDRDCENCTRTASGTSPFKLDTILVPVDFSDCSKKALQYAIPFARQFKAQMIFLHVLPLHYAAGWEFEVGKYDPLIEGDLRTKTEKQLQTLIQEHVPARIPTRIEVRHGAPAIEIVNAAHEVNAGLIIMSTHGHTGRIHAFIGSVAADVTRLAPCPVLVVREHEKDFVPSEISPAQALQDQPATAGMSHV
jgi:universal stress protein A